MKIGINYRRDIVSWVSWSEEFVWENRECFGFINVELVVNWGEYIYDKYEFSSYIGSGELRVCKWVFKVGWDGGLV